MKYAFDEFDTLQFPHFFFFFKQRFAIDFSWNRTPFFSGNPRGQEMDSCKSSRESLILQEHTLTAQFRSTLAPLADWALNKKDGENLDEI